MRGKVLMLSAVFVLALSGGSSADDADGALRKARQEGKAVMLELGSVGCVPCERMKPVMKRLSDNYSKLDVIFIDVRRDRDAAQRFHVFGIPTQVFLDQHSAC